MTYRPTPRPLYCPRRRPPYHPPTLTPEVLSVRYALVRTAERSFWCRVLDWLDKPFSLTKWS